MSDPKPPRTRAKRRNYQLEMQNAVNYCRTMAEVQDRLISNPDLAEAFKAQMIASMAAYRDILARLEPGK